VVKERYGDGSMFIRVVRRCSSASNVEMEL
jgi:hypothetical protein